MTMAQEDPDVLRWGLNELCILSTVGSAGCVTQYKTDCSQVGYVNEGYQESFYENVDSDDVIAHAFQDELSRVAAGEASGLNDPSQVSILAQDWLDPGRQNHSDVDDQNQGGEDTHDYSMNQNEKSNDPLMESFSEEDMVYSLEMTDESSIIDGEVGKRLNQMVPVPHIPKINGEMPSADEEITDHQRLLDRLQLYELVENKVQGDGNCQFRALSDQLYRSPEHHKFVRERVVSQFEGSSFESSNSARSFCIVSTQLECHPDMYAGYVPMVYDDYLKKMSKGGEWGDHVTLQAAADSYGVKIFVITSFKDTCYVEILPHVQKSKRVICLSFWAEVHYNSIYPEGELPVVVNKKKKKWWIL